ncbi:MAG TPA: potassium-transporting ATPase subunit KdpC [Candidatus Binatia bacterium]|jgi:K+-transporting ATPase ATPase C chain
MGTEIKRGVLYTLVTMVLFGGIYHVVVWGIATTLFPHQAEGSLIRDAKGTVIGSSLIAQKFTRPEYFQPRPSAVDYNAASTGASNYGPTNPDHLAAVRQRIDAIVAQEGVTPAQIPSEMVTTSGGGLDPEIPPTAAAIQVARIARARHVSADEVGSLVQAHTAGPLLGIFGRERVNVLELNLDLDRQLGKASQ